MSEAILDHPAPDKLLGDNYDKSKPRWDQGKENIHLSLAQTNDP